MFTRFLFIAMSCLLFSCVGGINTEQVDYSYVLHGGNSKLWILSFNDAGAEYKPLDLNDDFLIFYDNGRVVRSTFSRMGKKEFIDGTFEMNSESELLTIQFPQEKWMFKIKFNFDRNIELTPVSESDNQYILLLHNIPQVEAN